MDVGREEAAVRLLGGPFPAGGLDSGDAGAWAAFDLEVRWDIRYGSAPSDGPDAPGPDPVARAARALCHPDGRVREAALGEAVAHPVLLPLLVLRAADWVAPVRERARRLLTGVLDVRSAVALAPVVLRTGERERGTFAVGLLGAVLRQAPREEMLRVCAHPERAVRRFAVRLAVEEGRFSPAELARRAHADSDVVVQSVCADAALAALAHGDDPDGVLEPLLTARAPRVRAAGVTALRRAGLPRRAQDFLADRSTLVRACARYVVRQDGRDPLVWYRERCAGPEVPPGAVIGLAECGQRGDTAVLEPLLGHAEPRVRARAVAGLRVLDAADTARLLPLLDDPAPGVVREVVAALLPSARSLPDGALTDRLAGHRPRATRVGAFRLLAARGDVVGLRTAVELLGDADDGLRERAERAVRRWRPTELGNPEMGALLEGVRHLFDEAAFARRRWMAGLPR